MPALLSFYLSTLALLTPMMTCAGIGLYWGKKQLPFSASFLALLVTSVSTPALVFHTLITTELDNTLLLEIGGVSALTIIACMASCGIALRLLGLPVRALLQTAAFPNSGNLGLPISYLAFGDEGFSAAIVFFAVCAFMQNTIGVRTLPGNHSTAPFRSPVFLACTIAIVVRVLDLTLPSWLLESAQLLGSLTVPLMLISLGYALSSIPMSGIRSGTTIAILRLVLGFLTAWAVTSALGLDAILQGTMVLQMTMPCAVLSYMFATRYTDKGELAAGAVLVSTILFVLLSPLILALIDAPIPGG